VERFLLHAEERTALHEGQMLDAKHVLLPRPRPNALIEGDFALAEHFLLHAEERNALQEEKCPLAEHQSPLQEEIFLRVKEIFLRRSRFSFV
jgi:hypothetical protein